jgi:large subunit ribosomal protein L14
VLHSPQVIGFYGHQGGYASIGDVVKVVVKEARGEKVSPGDMRKAVIVEQKYPFQRKNGSHVQYLRNAAVLLSEKGQPIGNRIRSMLSVEFVKPRWGEQRALAHPQLPRHVIVHARNFRWHLVQQRTCGPVRFCLPTNVPGCAHRNLVATALRCPR